MDVVVKKADVNLILEMASSRKWGMFKSGISYDRRRIFIKRDYIGKYQMELSTRKLADEKYEISIIWLDNYLIERVRLAVPHLVGKNILILITDRIGDFNQRLHIL